MSERRRKKSGYRKISFFTDIGGIKTAIGEMRGLGHPPQPALNTNIIPQKSLFTEKWFIETIKDKVANHPENAMEYPFYGEKIFEDPIVGFATGDDPIFKEFKKVIGPHYFTPEEILTWQAKNNGVKPPPTDEVGVVVFALPMTQKTRQTNAAQTKWPSERWAQTRLLGEIFIQTMTREIVTHLMENEVLAVAPDATPMFQKKRYPDIGWASPWSHRHIAYAAGIGTFGMHDFLITEKGCVHRLGSFVVNLQLTPNRKRPDDIHAHCLQYQGKKCLKCAKRCPAQAITCEHAHDKEQCSKHVSRSIIYCNKNYHIFIYGCGLCSTGVPCESSIPEGLASKEK